MEKIVLIFVFSYALLFSSELSVKDYTLENYCLSCHKKNQIPSELIYKRYLMKYSTNKNMKDAMYSYMKNPKKVTSIMPTPFFLRFPMKEKISLSDKRLRKFIEEYLEAYDIRKKLILQP